MKRNATKYPMVFIVVIFFSFWPLLNSVFESFSPDYYDKLRMFFLFLLSVMVVFGSVRSWFISYPVLLFFVIGIVSSFYALSKLHAIVEVVFIFLVYVVVQRNCWSKRKIFFYRDLLVKSGLYFSIFYGVLFYFSLFAFFRSLPSYNFVVDIIPLFPFSENARYINSVQVILVFLPWLNVRLNKASKIYILIAFLATSITLSMLFLSGARSALLAVLVASAVFFILVKQKKVFVVYCFSIVLLSLSIYFLVSFFADLFFNKALAGDFFTRFVGLKSMSLNAASSSRIDLWLQAISFGVSNPLLGLGPQHFASLNIFVAHPHNFLVLIFSEWGVVAFLIVVYFVVCCFKYLFNIRMDCALVALFVGIFIDALLSGSLIYPVSQFYIALVFLLIPPRTLYSKGVFISSELSRAVSIVLLFGLLAMSVISYELSNLNPYLNAPRFWLNGSF